MTNGSRNGLARALLRPLWVVLALAFLLEAWLWDRLQPVVAAIVARIPLYELKARIALWIDRLPPAATLIVFLVPVGLLLPIKVLGLWLLAHGLWLAALATLVLAKLVGLGVTAFVFDVTRYKLLQMPWFRWLYERVVWARDWAHAQTEPIKRQIRAWARRLAPEPSSRTFRLLRKLRRRIQSRAAS